MNIATRSVLTAMAVLLSWVTSSAQSGLTLDLTTAKARQGEKAITTLCGGVGGAVVTSNGGRLRPPDLPLSLKIESLNRYRFSRGEDVVAVLSLTNVGSKSVFIPWSVDAQTIYKESCQWRSQVPGVIGLRGTLSLEFSGPAGQEQSVGAHLLYGSTSDAGTYRELAPHQIAIVKIWGTVDLSNSGRSKTAGKESETGIAQEFEVSASFDLEQSSVPIPYETLRSRNHVAVTVTEK